MDSGQVALRVRGAPPVYTRPDSQGIEARMYQPDPALGPLCRVTSQLKRGSGCGVPAAWGVIGDMFQMTFLSISSLARASTVGRTSRPSSFAVLRLITSSYLVGA